MKKYYYFCLALLNLISEVIINGTKKRRTLNLQKQVYILKDVKVLAGIIDNCLDIWEPARFKNLKILSLRIKREQNWNTIKY